MSRGRLKDLSPEQRTAFALAGVAGRMAKMSPELRQAIARAAIRARWARRKVKG